ncbi:alkene reductase [Parendozoicomonas haliclonae]|uniref:N-ethylmaleimide reductase n=1 Tax=Parendozoicomonas haliclonae TaxID=1960125 RepID=A0A1X7AQX8_9GAMM|nr:alkene reductase [Parendozoicomonas haliclonae]SMA50714.1 N-ethylmaleimide reductase [Parendozoicomonas haliclonae]
MTQTLFQRFEHNGFAVNNRIAMAPMTRSRTETGDVPGQMVANYYGQRAGAGLIITEGAPISAVGRGYSMTPGIYTPEQVAGWKQVTKPVHDKGGKIFIQLWHVGRRSHSSITGGIQPVSASDVKHADKVFGPLPEGGFGMVETEQPRALTVEEIKATVNDFVVAARNAIEAGFDGVEIHGAHGYLLDQFLRISSNQRTDQYGGSQDNRMRFLVEVMEAVAAEIGGHRTAIRLSPFVTEGYADEAEDPEITALTLKVLKALAPLQLAYVHFSENISRYTEMPDTYRQQVRDIYPHPIMVAGKYTQASGEAMLNAGYADMVAYGQPFITNPDLVYRMANNLPLNPVDYDAHATFYGGDERGYTDYPALEPQSA